jgi:uncharacterized protein
MIDSSEIISILKSQKEYLQQTYSVTSIGLFGSFSRGEQNKSSDVDLLIEFALTPDLFTFIEIVHYLKRKLKRKVDLVTPDVVRTEIRTQILKDVILI